MFFKKWRMRRRSRKLHEHLELRAHSAEERARYADRFSVKAFFERYDLRAELFCLYYESTSGLTGIYNQRDVANTLWPFIEFMNMCSIGASIDQRTFYSVQCEQQKKKAYIDWLRDDNVATWMIAEIRTSIELKRMELLGMNGDILSRSEELFNEIEEAKRLETLWKTKLESDEFKDVAEAHLEIVRGEQKALEECLTALLRASARLGKFFDACTKYILDLRPLIEVLVLAERTRVLQKRREELEVNTQATVSDNVAFVLGKMHELQGKLQTFGEEVGVVVGADRLPFDPRERMRMLVQSECVLAEQIDSIEHEITTPSFVSA